MCAMHCLCFTPPAVLLTTANHLPQADLDLLAPAPPAPAPPAPAPGSSSASVAAAAEKLLGEAEAIKAVTQVGLAGCWEQARQPAVATRAVTTVDSLRHGT